MSGADLCQGTPWRAKPSNAPLSYSRQALAPTAASGAGFSNDRFMSRAAVAAAFRRRCAPSGTHTGSDCVGAIVFSQSIDAEGAIVFEYACEMGLEGIVC
jgi:hypothetical protein